MCCLEANYTGNALEAFLELPVLSLCAPEMVGLGVSRWVNMETKVEHMGKGSFVSKYTKALVPAFLLSRRVVVA